MTILGIEQIIYGVTDLATCRRFFADWGLKEVAHDETHARFETLNGCTVLAVDANDPSLPPAFEEGPTLREVTWAWRAKKSSMNCVGASPVSQAISKPTTPSAASIRTAWRFAWK